MKCIHCGAEIQNEIAKFCTKCGKALPVQTVQQQSERVVAETATPVPAEPAKEGINAIWPEWEIEKKPIGKGSFGAVYKAVRKDHGVESYAAIKVISIPTDSSEVDSLRSEGLDINATRSYLQGIVNDFVSEIQLMESLKGVQNIVSVEDYKVVEKTGEIGWDIYIRMELLTPFNTYICDKKLTEEEVIKLGCDICTALEICSKRNIIHRDIKPENIFINDFGYFKLGDFGIARKMENMTGGLSQKGTFNYMAPEVANSSDYDARVDTYSLGIVLYRLLNGNRLPFLDTEKQLLNPNERRNAVDRRIRGEELPAPCDASPAMADLILRACAYDPNMRFVSATEMKQALMSVANGTYQMAASNLDRTTSVRKASTSYDKTTSVRKAPVASNQKADQVVNTFGSTPKKNNLPKIIVAVLAVVLLVGAGIFAVPKLFDGDGTNNGTEASTGTNEGTTSETSDYSKQDEERIATIIAEADALAQEENYKDALAKIKTGLVTYPKSAELLQKQEEYTAALNAQVKATTLAEAEQLANGGDYVAAMAVIKEAQKQAPDDADYASAYEKYNAENNKQIKQDAIEEADGYAKNNDYLSAMTTIDAALKQVGEDETLQTLSDTYSDAYVADVLAQVEAHIQNAQYDAAKELLNNATTAVPDSEDLQEKKDEVEQYKSISVRSLTPVNASGTWNETNVKLQNALGENFSNALNFFIPCQNSYGEYYINGQYTMVTGNLTSYYQMEEGRICSFQIWADNTIIYNSPVIAQKTKQFSFAVVLPKGTQNIKFVCAANGYSCSEILLTDLILLNDPHYYENHPSNGSVAVRSLTPINAVGNWNSIPLIMENALGNSLSGAQSFFIPCQNSYGEYYIDGNYVRVSGNVTSCSNMEEGRECTLQILADDKIIYTSPTITQYTKQISFDITLPEGTQFVKFVCKANGYSNSEIFITELFLWP